VSALASNQIDADNYSTDLNIPEILQPWIPWVLHDVDQKKCSVMLNQDEKNCLWTEPLSLDLEEKQAVFLQNITLEHSGWFYLPGKAGESWPEDVMIDDQMAVVVTKNNLPAIFIDEPGSYSINGKFYWNHLPKHLHIPKETGLVSPVTLNGKIQTNIKLKDDMLWIASNKKESHVNNALQLHVYRLITDTFPLTINTRIELNVSGDPRETILDWRVPDNQIPLTMESVLPVNLGKDRKLRVQVRPGKWVVNFTTRTIGKPTVLHTGKTGKFWPKKELWSFKSQNHLRTVEIKGANQVDPSIESIPSSWKQFPAYIMTSKSEFIIEVKMVKNIVSTPNKLQLERTYWLDESGKGMTIKDIITGSISTGKRLEMHSDYLLGQVKINHQNQLITHLDNSNIAGVEVRRGDIHVDALSRSEKINDLSAVGWNNDMKKVSAMLNLPPGWTLVYQTGIDSAKTWVSKLTLYNIFFILIISLSVGKLFNIKSGLISFITLLLTVFICKESIALRDTWIALLFCISILRIIPKNKYSKFINFTRYSLIGTVIIILILFIRIEVKNGLYPQLEKNNSKLVSLNTLINKFEGSPSAAPLNQKSARTRMKKADTGANVNYAAKGIRLNYLKNNYDVNAKIQSGPGLPTWRWNRVAFSWNGPVMSKQKIKLYFLSPSMNVALSFIISALLILTTMILLKNEFTSLKLSKFGRKINWLLFSIFFLLINIYSPIGNAQTISIPNNAMLESLKDRLVDHINKPAICGDYCADITKMDITINNDNMNVELLIPANIKTAIPLPQSENWMFSAITANDKPASLYKKDNTIWVMLDPGINHITLSGVIYKQSIQLSFPSQFVLPHKVKFNGNSLWKIQGVNENGVPGSQLGFQKIKTDNRKREILESGNLPPLVRIERIIQLGMDWKITTIATRISPVGSPILLEIPMLEGESVISSMPIKNNNVQLQLGKNEKTKKWESIFTKQKEFALTAFDSLNLTETWTLDAGIMWNVEVNGKVSVSVGSKSGSKLLIPTWFPRPNESIHFFVTKPKGVKGSTKTIESSSVQVTPGIRSSDYDLTFLLRSTRGGTHTIKLPKDAKLQTIKIDGNVKYISQNNRKITIPTKPGQQRININWTMDHGISFFLRSADIDLGMDSVNSSVSINVGNRWVWFVNGPTIGPAILYYSLLLSLIIGSLILGATYLTPLKWYHWALLCFGISNADLSTTVIIILWFLILGLKSKYLDTLKNRKSYNFLQIGIVIMSIVSFIALLYAINSGLLGHPDMMISGNNSTNHILNWYQDRIVDNVLPQPLIISVHPFVYRCVMLTWALWLSFNLLKWFKWAWRDCFASGGIWRKKQCNQTLPVETKE